MGLTTFISLPHTHGGNSWLASCVLTILAVELDHKVAVAATEGDAALFHSLLHHRQRAEDGQEGLGKVGHQPGTVPPWTSSTFHVGPGPSLAQQSFTWGSHYMQDVCTLPGLVHAFPFAGRAANLFLTNLHVTTLSTDLTNL